jgi:anti-anti-sigma factor
MLSIEQAGVIRLAGELDMSTVPELDPVLEAAAERGGAVLVDLTELTFMDSTGIHALTKAARSLGGRGCLILHGEQERVGRVFDLVGINGNVRGLHRLAHDGGGSADDTDTGSLAPHPIDESR